MLDFAKLLKQEHLRMDEPMARHTTFRVGGPADYMYFPDSEEDLLNAIDCARRAETPCIIIGNGSNLVVRDGGIRGLVIVLGDAFAGIRAEDTRIIAQTGVSMAKTACFAQEHGLSGLEFASGIPGTLGGGCAMNAGAYGGQISDVLISARVLLDGEIRTLSRDEMQMGYRTTLPLTRGGIVLSAIFELRRDDPAAILARMKDLNARRREKQPLNLPSAGSMFKRPEGHFAGALIQECGLKGARVGGAQVSEKHAGFVVNAGGATAADILNLVALVQRTVLERTGIALEMEPRVLGDE